MGIGPDFGSAFAKSQIAAGNSVPLEGTVFISIRDEDKPYITEVAREISEAGFNIMATGGTERYLGERGVDSEKVFKVGEGRPDIVDRIKSGEVDMVINTSFGVKSIADSFSIRRSSLEHGLPYFTTIAAAKAAIRGIKKVQKGSLGVKTIQEYHKEQAHQCALIR